MSAPREDSDTGLDLSEASFAKTWTREGDRHYGLIVKHPSGSFASATLTFDEEENASAKLDMISSQNVPQRSGMGTALLREVTKELRVYGVRQLEAHLTGKEVLGTFQKCFGDKLKFYEKNLTDVFGKEIHQSIHEVLRSERVDCMVVADL